MFSILGFRRLLFQHVHLLLARDTKIILTATATQANRIQCHKSGEWSCLLPWAWIIAPWMGGPIIQASFHFLSGCRCRREGELQHFCKLNLSFGSPADWQRSHVSSSNKEKRQKLFPQSLISSKNLIPTAIARCGFII